METSLCLTKLSSDEKRILLSECSVKEASKGSYIFRRGDTALGYYGVWKGRARASVIAESGKALSLTIFHPGEWFGEISMIDGMSRTHDVEAIEDLTLLMMPERVFEKYLLTNIESMRWVSRSVCARLRMAMQFIEEVTTQPLPRRLANRLLVMHPNTRNTSQEELSQMLGVSRQSISKILNQWNSQSMISIEYGGVKILDLNALKIVTEKGGVSTISK